MRKEIDTYELIEGYLTGSLSSEEHTLIKKTIAEDKDFAREVIQHKELFSAIEDKVFLDIKDKIKNIHQNSPSQLTNWRSKGGNLFIIGLSVFIGFITVMILLYLKQPKQESLPTKQVVLTNDSAPEKIIIETSPKEPGEKIPKRVVQAPKVTETVNPGEPTSQEPKADSILIQDTIPDPEIILPEPTIQQKDSLPNLSLIAPQESVKAQEPENNQTNIDQNNCENVIIDAIVSTKESCDSKPSGKIAIKASSIEGGSPPYQISIDNGANFYSRYLFENLYASIYKVVIKDKNNCTSKTRTYRIDGVDCSYSYNFAPERGERWEIPTRENIGKLKIFNTGGVMVYQANFDFPGSYYWFGKTNAGQALPMGAYSFILELENEQPLLGNVTIIR